MQNCVQKRRIFIIRANSATARSLLRNGPHSVRAIHATTKPMQLKYRSYQREGGAFYWQENGTSKRGSLRTKDLDEVERLLAAMNDAHRQPALNLALGRAYLSSEQQGHLGRIQPRGQPVAVQERKRILQ